MHRCQRCGKAVVLDDVSIRFDVEVCIGCADHLDEDARDAWRSEQLVSSYQDDEEEPPFP